MSKLSIITINKNNCVGLQKTIDSVLSQTWHDFEWIVIDGDSTDGSKELIEKYQKHFTYWCSEPDSGVYPAMNKGLAHAQGEWVNFMNSGDCFADSKTLDLIFSQHYEEDILYGYMMRKSLEGKPMNIPFMKKQIHWDDFYFSTIPHQSSYIRRALFQKLGGYDESYQIVADRKWFFNAIAVNGCKTRFVDAPFSIYESDGISDSEHCKDDFLKLRKELFPDYIPDEDYRHLRDIHLIMETTWSRIAYKVIRKLFRKHNQLTKNREIQRIQNGRKKFLCTSRLIVHNLLL